MTEWLKLSDEDRLISIQQASAKSGIATKVIEKDWWVTLVLKALFQLEFTPYLSFKGGTSLSKGWGLIGRFSEDIDLAIERGFLGFGEELTKSAVKRLKRTACEFTSTALKDTLAKELLALDVPEDAFEITADPVPETLKDTVDPQTLRIAYRPLIGPVQYIDDHVKVEVSARSLNEPAVERLIHSLLGEYMPGFTWSGEPFPVPTVEPKRTFMEKAFLLHENFLQPAEKIGYHRMSRHLYDLERLMDTEHASTALADPSYYQKIVAHRRQFIFKSGVDYDTHQPDTIHFLPPATVQKAFKEDYLLMREQMIYDPESKSFAVIIERLTVMLEYFRQVGKEKPRGPV